MMNEQERDEAVKEALRDALANNKNFRRAIVEKEVDAAVKRWGTVFGIANFAVIGAIIVGVFTSINSVASVTVKEQIDRNTKLLDGPIQAMMSGSMNQVVKMQTTMKNMEDQLAVANANLARARQSAEAAQRSAEEAQKTAETVNVVAKKAATLTPDEWNKLKQFIDYLAEHKEPAEMGKTVAVLQQKMGTLERVIKIDGANVLIEGSIRLQGPRDCYCIIDDKVGVRLKGQGERYIDVNNDGIMLKDGDNYYLSVGPNNNSFKGGLVTYGPLTLFGLFDKREPAR